MNRLIEFARTWQTRQWRLAPLAAALLLLCVWLLLSAQAARDRLDAGNAALRVEAARLESRAQEYTRLRDGARRTATTTDLRALAESAARARGIADTVLKAEATGNGRLLMELRAVAFADWLDWVRGLQTEGVRVESCRIDTAGPPGRVNVAVTLALP